MTAIAEDEEGRVDAVLAEHIQDLAASTRGSGPSSKVRAMVRVPGAAVRTSSARGVDDRTAVDDGRGHLFGRARRGGGVLSHVRGAVRESMHEQGDGESDEQERARTIQWARARTRARRVPVLPTCLVDRAHGLVGGVGALAWPGAVALLP